MRKNKLLFIFVLLLLVVLAFTFVACSTTYSNIEIDEGDDDEYEDISASTLLMQTIQALGSSEDFVGMNFDSEIKVSDGNGGYDIRNFYIKGNFYTEEDNEYIELGLGVLDEEGSGIEFFLKNGRLFVKTGDLSLYIQDIDFNWLIEQIKKLESVDTVLEKVLSLLPIDLPGLNFETIIGLLGPLLFEVDDYSVDGMTENISLKIVPDMLIDTVKGLLADVDIDAALANLGINLGFSLNDLIQNFTFPAVDIYLKATINNGVANDNSFAFVIANDIEEDIFRMSSTSGFTAEKVEFIPDNIAEYVPFGLLKFQFDTTISLEGKNVDVAKIVNMFAGTNMLPEGDLILNADLGLSAKLVSNIRIKPNFDDPKNKDDLLYDESMFLFEIYSKHNPAVPLLGAYLKNNNIYINIDNVLNMFGENISLAPKNIIVKDLFLSQFLYDWLEAGKNTLAGIIDQVFPKDGGEATISQESVVLSIAVDGDGKQYISPTIGSIIDLVRNVSGFGDYIAYDDNSIDVTVNSQLFEDIKNRFGVEMPDIPDFGSVVLSVEFSDVGLDNISLTADLQEKFDIFGKITIDNIKYGLLDEDYNGTLEKLSAKIEKAIAGKNYTSNLKELIFSAIDDIDASLNIKVTLPAGRYDLSDVVKMIMGMIPEAGNISIPSLPIEIDQTLVLDLDVVLQTQMDTFDEADNADNKVISRAKVAIVNKIPNLIFNKAGEVISAYYFDDRYSGNDRVGLTKKDGINKKTNGTLFIDMSGFNLLNINLPCFALDIDLSSVIIDALNSIELGDIVIPTLPPAQIPDVDLGLNAVAQQNVLSKDQTIVQAMYTGALSPKMLSVVLSTKVINSLLQSLGVEFILPEMDMSLTVDSIEGIVLRISGKDYFETEKEMSVDLSIAKAVFGKPHDVDIENFNINNYKAGVVTSVEDIIYTALDDVNLQMSLKIELKKGTYNLAPILNLLGLEVSEVPVSFTEDFILDLSLLVQLQLEDVEKTDANGKVIKIDGKPQYEKIIAGGYVGLRNNKENLLFKNVGDIISAYYFDDRYAGNAENILEKYEEGKKTHGTLFLNFSGLNIANIKLPNTNIDVDLTAIVKDAIGSLDLPEIDLSDIFNKPQTFSALSTMANESGDEVVDAQNNYLQIVITVAMINEILQSFDVPSLEGVDFDLSVKIDQENGLIITFKGSDNFEELKEINAKLSMDKFAVGVQNKIDTTYFKKLEYQTNIADLVKVLMKEGSISATLDLSSSETAIDLRNIINSIMALSGQMFTMPINIDVSDFNSTFDALIQWQFDFENASNSTVLAEIKCDSNLVLGFYVASNNFYLDLSGLGLPKVMLENTTLVETLVDLIDGLIGDLISTILHADGFAYSAQAMLAEQNGESVAQMNNRIFAEAMAEVDNAQADASDPMEYISVLINGLSVNDGVFALTLTKEMASKIMDILALNINEEISVDANVDIFKGLVKLKAQFDEVIVDAKLSIDGIGAIVDKEQLPTDLTGSSYAKLNGASGALLADSLFNALEPGLWMELITNTVSTKAKGGVRNTKLYMQKSTSANPVNFANGGSAPNGSYVIWINRLDGDKGGAPNGDLLYIVINPNSNSITVKLTNNLVPKVAGVDVVGIIGDISIPVGEKTIKELIADLFDPLLVSINDMGKVAPVAEKAEDGAGIDILGLINGINVKVFDCRNVMLNVNFNHRAFTDLLVNIITSLNGQTIDIGMGPITINGLVYNNREAWQTWQSFEAGLLDPIINAATSGMGGLVNLVAGKIKDSIFDLFMRILPMPDFVELNANVHILQGRLDNLQFVGYGAMTPAPSDRDRFDLRIFNDITNKNMAFVEMDRYDTQNVRYQKTVVTHDVASNANIADLFVKTAYQHKPNGQYYDNVFSVKWEVGAKWNGTKFVQFEDWISIAEFAKNMELGRYQVFGNAGDTEIMIVELNVVDHSDWLNLAGNNPETGIYVEDVVVPAGGNLPRYITLKKRGTEDSFKTNLFKFEGGAPTQLGEHTVQAQVVINGVKLPINILYKDNEMVLEGENEPYRINIHDYKNFYNNVYNRGEIFVKTSEGKTVFSNCTFTIEGNNQQLFNPDGSLANLNLWMSEEGFTTEVTIKLPSVDKGQRAFKKQVIVEGKKIAYVRFDSKNTIILNNYQDAQDIPNTADIYFADGTFKNFSLTWDLSNVTFGKAGEYKAVLNLNSDYDGVAKAGGLDLDEFEVNVIINQVEVAYAKVGASNGVRDCEISYEEFVARNFAQNIRLITTDGKVINYKAEYTTYEQKVENGELVWQKNDAGEFILNEDGQKIPVMENVKHANYKFNDADLVVSEKGGIVRVRLTLYNGDDKNTNGHEEVYIYFKVAPKTV